MCFLCVELASIFEETGVITDKFHIDYTCIINNGIRTPV